MGFFRVTMGRALTSKLSEVDRDLVSPKGYAANIGYTPNVSRRSNSGGSSLGFHLVFEIIIELYLYKLSP